MAKFLERLKKGSVAEAGVEEYEELDIEKYERELAEVPVRNYIKLRRLKEFNDVQGIGEELHKGNVVITNITPLANRDMSELKRAIETLKGLCKEIGGDIAGLGEDRVIVTPTAIKIARE